MLTRDGSAPPDIRGTVARDEDAVAERRERRLVGGPDGAVDRHYPDGHFGKTDRGRSDSGGEHDRRRSVRLVDHRERRPLVFTKPGRLKLVRIEDPDDERLWVPTRRGRSERRPRSPASPTVRAGNSGSDRIPIRYETVRSVTVTANAIGLAGNRGRFGRWVYSVDPRSTLTLRTVPPAFAVTSNHERRTRRLLLVAT